VRNTSTYQDEHSEAALIGGLLSRRKSFDMRSLPIPPKRDAFSDAFAEGMVELGYREGINLAVEWHMRMGIITASAS